MLKHHKILSVDKSVIRIVFSELSEEKWSPYSEHFHGKILFEFVDIALFGIYIVGIEVELGLGWSLKSLG